jgi:hypothetical protein
MHHSLAVSINTRDTRELTALPVMMIGPCAPNGLPEPMTTAEESGLSAANLGFMMLLPNRIASNACGIP